MPQAFLFDQDGSAEDFHARTYRWLDDVLDLLESGADSSTSSCGSSMNSVPAGFSSKTSLDCFPVAAVHSAASWPSECDSTWNESDKQTRWQEIVDATNAMSGKNYIKLIRDAISQSSCPRWSNWAMGSPAGFLMLSGSESHSVAAVSSLSDVLETSGVPLKAMILLGINAGMGNADCGHLPLAAVDLKNGWLDFPRPKTAVARRVPLWPETLAALKAAIETRPAPKDEADAGLVFLTVKGHAWAKAREITTGEDGKEKAVADNPIAKETRKLLNELGIKRPGATFYSLRHVFQTIGEESGDQVATRSIMGHAPSGNDMSAVYRERISDERLQRVVNHVRDWLLTADRGDEKEPKDGWAL